MSAPHHTHAHAPGRPLVRAGGGFTAWDRHDRRQAAGVLAAVAALHVAGFGLLALAGRHAPGHGGATIGLGLGLTAYTYGLRHAFDADHIAAIDNTTRTLRADGRRPKAVGLWFALGHSAVVALLTVLVATGARVALTLTGGDSATARTLGVVGTTVSGTFLYLVAALNVAALVSMARTARRVRAGELDPAHLEHTHAGGPVTRVLGRLTRTVSRPGHMVLVGFLFGLGFDTATEVALLVMAGTGAAAGLPWYAVMALPLLFASGMTLLDSLDGLLMSAAYDWALLDPARKVTYNLAVTGLSVAVALGIGTVELVGVLHDDLGWHGGLVDAVAGVDLGSVGFAVAGLFVVVWGAAALVWRTRSRRVVAA